MNKNSRRRPGRERESSAETRAQEAAPQARAGGASPVLPGRSGAALPSARPEQQRHLGGATGCERRAAESSWQRRGGRGGSWGWGRALVVTFPPTGGVTRTAFWSCSGSWCSWRSLCRERDFCCPRYPDCYKSEPPVSATNKLHFSVFPLVKSYFCCPRCRRVSGKLGTPGRQSRRELGVVL